MEANGESSESRSAGLMSMHENRSESAGGGGGGGGAGGGGAGGGGGSGEGSSSSSSSHAAETAGRKRHRADEVSGAEEDTQAPKKLPPLSVPAEGRLHLLPFLIPTTICDADNAAVIETARSLIPAGSSVREKAILIRAWIREHIKYTLDDKKAKASDTLAKREGMCTNKANLQIAMLRAVGVPCGYRLVHITKECFRSPQMLPELFEKIHEPTVHCFAAVYIPDVGMDGKCLPTGQWHNFDATERRRGEGEACTFLLEEHGTGETRYQDKWVRGPFGPVQANLDHLLLMKPSQRWKLAKDLFDRQNEILRKHGNV